MYRIGIMGKANSGKNTLARVLVKSLRGKGYLSADYIAFANPIKEMIRAMYPKIPKKFLYGPSILRNEVIPNAFKNNNPLTIRQLLIDLGTAGREYDPNTWLDNFDHAYKQSAHRSIVVVTDVRFRNELDHLRSKDFYMIRLYRNEIASSIKYNHISEVGQNDIKDDEFDYILHNNSSIKELRAGVEYNIIPRLRDI